QPDTTARGVAANNYALQNYWAFPGDVSPLPLYGHRPTEARATLRNESNLALALRVGSVHDPVSGAPSGQGDYLRFGLDPWAVSWGRKAQSGPLTLDTLMPRVDDPAGAGTRNLLNRALWDVLAPGTEDVAGEDTWMANGTTTRALSSGLITAGTYSGRPIAKPVPFGQPVGLYSGRHPQYLDVNGNGALDFNHWDGSAYVPTTTASTEYNPSVDLPLEPLVGVVEGQMRVVETRIPQSDYYSADNDPIVLPSPTPGVMQVIWSSNRVSADSASTGYTAGQPAVAGADPTDMPSSRSPLNLIYMTTSGYTDASDPLYRQYVWPAAGSGAISPAAALTNQPDSPAGRITNSSPWAMYDLAGNKWSFWHRSQPNAGGVESTLRYNGPLGAAAWNWNLAAEKFIYDTGQPKQGMRGFWGANGAWLFWHEGAPGRERLMFRWNFDPTAAMPTPNETYVPVTNQAGAGISDLVNAPTTGLPTPTYPIRKAGTSPFTYTRDTSVFVHTPPNGIPTVNLFFSGFVTQEGQTDICWTRFNANTMVNAASANAWRNDNYSKLPFPRMTDEELEPDGLHQLFASRHLDWMVGRNSASDMPVVRAFFPGNITVGAPADPSPAFRLVLGYHDTIGDGVAQQAQSFDVSWSTTTDDNRYDRARGTYLVTPVLMPVAGSTLPARCRIGPAGGPWELRDPNSPAGNPRPLTMTI
ncbi:MAG: hypothetical protein KKI08_05295, partial [Armatimonadetes bacterium]|nr:hypothetical protein [Armatimonadota bacterium]